MFERAYSVANMTTLPVGEDGEVVPELRARDWLEQFILQIHRADVAASSSPAISKEEETKKSDKRKGKRVVPESDDEEESVKAKKKKKTKHSIASQSNRKTRLRKKDESPESKSFLFELEQLELEDHMEVSRYQVLAKVQVE